jgi:hypothetical protein
MFAVGKNPVIMHQYGWRLLSKKEPRYKQQIPNNLKIKNKKTKMCR